MALGRHEEALAAYDRALEIDRGASAHDLRPEIAAAHVGRGDALEELGRHARLGCAAGGNA